MKIKTIAICVWMTLPFSMSLPAAAQSSGSATPAEAYCNDLRSGVNQKLQESVQRRMPSQMPGDYMDEVFGVGDIISTEVDYGIGSTQSLIDLLISFLKGMLSSSQQKLLGSINQVVNSSINSSTNTITMPPVSQSTSTGVSTHGIYTGGTYSNSGGISAPSLATQGINASGQAAQSQGATQQQGSTGGVGSQITNFFKNLF